MGPCFPLSLTTKLNFSGYLEGSHPKLFGSFPNMKPGPCSSCLLTANWWKIWYTSFNLELLVAIWTWFFLLMKTIVKLMDSIKCPNSSLLPPGSTSFLGIYKNKQFCWNDKIYVKSHIASRQILKKSKSTIYVVSF